MLFLKIMFWFMIVGIGFHVIYCCMDHPRAQKPLNIGTDIITLLEKIAIAIFFWLYTYGGWVVK